MKTVVLIFLGGGFGSLARYGFYRILDSGSLFPFGTFVANIISSFLLGYIIGNFKMEDPNHPYYLLLGVGFCGAFSTFSTFSWESFDLLTKAQYFTSFLYITTSFLLGILAVYLGLLCTENG